MTGVMILPGYWVLSSVLTLSSGNKMPGQRTTLSRPLRSSVTDPGAGVSARENLILQQACDRSVHLGDRPSQPVRSTLDYEENVAFALYFVLMP